MIMQKLQQWHFAQIVEHGMFITQFVVSVVITDVNWQLRKM